MLPQIHPAVRPAVPIRDLYKSIETVTAITGVSAEIGHIEFFMIVGPSGCCKTTLLRILAGLETIAADSIEIEMPDTQRLLNSMIFQGNSFFPG